MLANVQQLSRDVASVATASVWSLSDEETVTSLKALHRLEQTLAGVQLRLARHAEERGIPSRCGYATLGRWLRAELRLDTTPSREMATRATLLARWPEIAQAVLDGVVDVRQAEVIASTVDHIPDTLAAVDAMPGDTVADKRSHAEIVKAAQDRLLELAEDFSSLPLRRLGNRILDHVAPEIAERANELALQRAEARALTRRGFTLSKPDPNGLIHVTGALSVEDAAIINAALQPLCTPRPDDDRTAAQKRADALVAVCQLALRTGQLPEHGGEPPQVNVTVPYDSVKKQLGAGTLENGERVSAETVRRLACDALILPFLLGGAGQILNAGRARRTATGALRRAVMVRDGGCTFPGCEQPPRWTEHHHIISWADGGDTGVKNLVLLCRPHHRLIHNPLSGWQVQMAADELPEFLPPVWDDPQQQPRRNHFHLQL